MKRTPKRTVIVREYETGRDEGVVDIVDERAYILYRFHYNRYDKEKVLKAANALAERQKGLLGI